MTMRWSEEIKKEDEPEWGKYIYSFYGLLKQLVFYSDAKYLPGALSLSD